MVMQSRKYLFYMHALAGGGTERVWALDVVTEAYLAMIGVVIREGEGKF